MTGYIVDPFSRSDVSHPAAHIKCPGLLLLLRLHCPSISRYSYGGCEEKNGNMQYAAEVVWLE